MSTAPMEPDAEDGQRTKSETRETTELAAQVELLDAENQRLRAEYNRIRQVRYTRTGYGLGLIGLLALGGGVVFPAVRDVLFVLGLTGLFGAVLTWYLTPASVIAGSVSDELVSTVAENYERIVAQLGLTDERVYLPSENRPAKLFIPGNSEYELPDPEDGPFVVTTEQRGLLLEATGASLFDEFSRAVTGEVATTPAALATQLGDSLVEQFELVSAVEADVDNEQGQALVRVSNSTFTGIDNIDNPIVSFLAVGFASTLDKPVSVEVTDTDERADWLITLRWDNE